MAKAKRGGAKRVAQPSTTVTSITMTQALLKAVRRRADKLGLSVSGYVRSVLERDLEGDVK